MIVLKPGVSKVPIDDLAFSPDGAMLAAPALTAGVMLWNALASGTSSEVVSLPNGDGADHLSFAPDGRTLLAGCDHLYTINLTTRKIIRVPTERWARLSFGVSPDSKWILVTELQRDNETSRLTCWATNDFGSPKWRVDARSTALLQLLFPPASATFIHVGCNHSSEAYGWGSVSRSIADGNIVAKAQPLFVVPTQAALSPDGNNLALRFRGQITLYADRPPWTFFRVIQNDTKKHFTGIAFHPSGRYLAATSNDATVKLYDTTTWAVAKTFTWNIGRMRSIAFSPDGTLAAAGSDTGKVVVWDVDV